ncbi:S-adenosyl-L-methionine-dependent methyltransferase [Apiospora phragmitis]|uniref:S-adenosyl-L-methionine-dependent methyltransferase n=1 Tax=Apiospora phragmitis TaxID=2905665 RepID=A0ABR1WWG0_9PEZI
MRKRERDMKSGSHEDILALDIKALLESQNATEGDDAGPAAEESLPEQGSHIDVEVVELSSTGDGLAQLKGSKQVYVVPFAVPGDTVKVKAYRHMQEGYTIADFISIVKPSPLRDDSRINCKYFTTCSGCQFQMLDYAEQLRLKRRIVEKAYRNFSELPPELVPTIQDTIGSPLQYGYRTKLTPHFDGPSGWSRGKNPFTSRPPIGYMPKGSRKTIDIEDCPIGTDAVRVGMKKERERMETEFNKYTRGSTILLRESTQRVRKDAPAPEPPVPSDAVVVESDRHTDYKTCVTDNKGMSTEYIDDFVFHNPAGSFFQNNNSILPPFTDYIRQHILPKSDSNSPPIKYLVDAYSGSGLFTITLSSQFQQSVGIDIAEQSIEYARKNASANNLPPSQAKFIAADANELFGSLGDYPPDETVVMLDPPRKGCDANFIRQLLRFGPKRVVYVSCNVHTQARDVGLLVRGETGEADKAGGEQEAVEGGTGKKVRYDIESLIGFDFFPQTGHVEGVAVLNRVDVEESRTTTEMKGVEGEAKQEPTQA